MFASIAAAGPTLSASTSPASPTTPSRSGRLRGLSYLRTYTHNHLHPQSNTPQAENRSNRPPLSRSSSSPAESSPPSRNTSSIRVQDATSPSPHRSALDLTPNGQPNTTAPTASFGSPGALTAQTHSITVASPAVGSHRGTVSESNDSPASPPMTRSRVPTTPRAAAPPIVPSSPGPAPSVEGTDSAPQNTQITEDPGWNSVASPSGVESSQAQLPSIRFIPYQDPRAARPSLQFVAISRTLPNTSTVIRVGRYSERDQTPEAVPNTPSAAPVGFKSKVVSRRHCEFSYQNSQWYVKDVKSSSGTFLNHIRLSPAGHESRLWPVNDGDVLQLGIDFRGGEEMIFRCVKIRIELNRGWQKGLNNFNKSAHKRIRNLSKNAQKKDSDAASTHTSECAICLLTVSPCQSLFVAPCSHVWHYKCIRPILNGRTYPQFTCPNCRMLCDLEADVDELSDFDMDEEDEDVRHESSSPPQEALELPNANAISSSPSENLTDSNLAALVRNVTLSDSPPPGPGHAAETTLVCPDPPQWGESSPLRPAVVHPSTVSGSESSYSDAARSTRNGDIGGDTGFALRTPRSSANYALSPDLLGPEGPMTPRNDAGPFILDGSAGRSSMRGLASLDPSAAVSRGQSSAAR